jgi:hypothetical protein
MAMAVADVICKLQKISTLQIVCKIAPILHLPFLDGL